MYQNIFRHEGRQSERIRLNMRQLLNCCRVQSTAQKYIVREDPLTILYNENEEGRKG